MYKIKPSIFKNNKHNNNNKNHRNEIKIIIINLNINESNYYHDQHKS